MENCRDGRDRTDGRPVVPGDISPGCHGYFHIAFCDELHVILLPDNSIHAEAPEGHPSGGLSPEVEDVDGAWFRGGGSADDWGHSR